MVLTGTDALPLDTPVRPYTGYTSRFDTTDALPLDTPVRPYKGLHVAPARELLGCLSVRLACGWWLRR